MRLGPAAVRAGDLLCLSALYAADENGAIAPAIASASLRYFGAPVPHQMRAILDAAEEICRAGGSVARQSAARASLPVGSQPVVYPALRVWQDKLPGAALPFGAVRPPAMPIPGCDVILDAWFYRPGH